MYPLLQVKSYPSQHLGEPLTHVFVQLGSQVPGKNLELHAHIAPPFKQTLLHPAGQTKL